MTITRILSLILAILIGVFMFVYGEIDDSPGGQLIGVLVVVISIIIFFKKKKVSN